jgi:hypothetical protein
MSDYTQGGSAARSGDDYGEFRGLLDQLDRHAESAPAAASRDAAAAAPGDQICQYWPTLRTVLEIVLRLPFIPAKVKDVIRNAIPIFDRFCRNS